MSLFTSCFGQKDEERIYLAGWEARFNGDSQCEKFIRTQGVDSKTAKTIWSSIELVFENKKLVHIYEYDEGLKSEREIEPSEQGFQFVDILQHRIFQLQAAPESQSYIGGEAPSELKIPSFDFNAPFQYLGLFSNKEEVFSWLPFDLHLIAPLYSNFDKLYIDYTDPMKPIVLNEDELQRGGSSYEDLKPNSEIVFSKVSIKGVASFDYGDGVGHTGVPNWIQYPDIPACPKSKRTMRFLCQLHDENGVSVQRTTVTPKEEFYQRYFSRLNFWGDGDLYIFFEPDSKVACLLIQHT